MMTPEQPIDPFELAEEESEEVDAPPVVTLQAAIAWIATRDVDFTFSFRGPRLVKMDQLIAEADLRAAFTVSESWALLRDAIVSETVHAWGSKFEFPEDFELGEPWPRGSHERLPAHALARMCLIDVRGMAACPEGIISVGQTWYCRISIQKDELQSTFPFRFEPVKPITKNEPNRAHKRAFVEDVLRKKWPSPVRPENVTVGMMTREAVGEAKRQNRPPPSEKTVIRARDKVWPRTT